MFPKFFMDFDFTSVVMKRDEVFFRIVEPGLSGKPGTCSIESMDYPGRYLHCPPAQQKVYLLEHEDPKEEPAEYKEAATFIEHKSHFYAGKTAFESATRQTEFL